MTQWHPIFAQLLRPVVEGYYDVQTTVPVGDAPREADFVLLRRTVTTTPPFRGLWRNLTAWNILEFKGPTVSPRLGDIELLVELGLGIDRRFQAERLKQRQRKLPPGAVSFWYLANHLGRRFLAEVERKLGALESLASGLWRCQLLGRQVFWVSGIDLPVEEDSLPLHIVGVEPQATERQVAQFVVEQPELQKRYGGWLASLHSVTWKEVEAMARATGKQLVFDIRPAIDSLGLGAVIEQVGLDRVIQEVGLEPVLQRFGKQEVAKRIGIEDYLASLTDAKRKELKRRLQ